METTRYPVGKYEPAEKADALLKNWKTDIQFLPSDLENAILNLDAAQLMTPYRDGGWSAQQLVHHLADSHMNAYIRFRLALTEHSPVIKPYDQDAWASMDDYSSVPVNVSITLLHALHLRWINLINDISGEAWERKVIHPEYKREMSLWYLLGLYAWHGRHHVAQIMELRKRNNWL